MACSVFSCSSPAGRHSHHSMSNGGLTIRCHIHKLLSYSKWPVQCDSFPQQWEKQHHSYSFHFHIFNNKKQTLIKACRAAKGGGAVMLTLHVLSQRMNGSHFLSLSPATYSPVICIPHRVELIGIVSFCVRGSKRLEMCTTSRTHKNLRKQYLRD